MKICLIIAALSLFLTGCRSLPQQEAAENSNSVPAAGTGRDAAGSDKQTAVSEQPPAEAPVSTEFRKETFEAKNLPKEFAHEGRIVDGAKWTDANGQNTLIVTEKGPRGEASTHRIYGYLYAVKDGSTKLLWKIQDFADNPCDTGKGLVSPVDVRDIDGDGVAENMFVYNVEGACDVSPITYKLMMHSGEKKLAVRGTNSVNVPGIKVKGKKNFDPAFDGAPAEFRRAASDFWDRHVKPLE